MILRPHQAQRLASLLAQPDGDDPAPGTALGGRVFGNYRVARLVGVGGMGEVYEAQQDRTGRRVAIKVIRPELISADLSRRFEHEVRVLARLQHPGIAQVYEAGRVETPGGNTPYFAMEYVEGMPLTKYAADKKLSIRQRLDLFLKVCDGVEHAHRKGIIHRDLKPANILVDATGEPRILDFGVARATDSDVAATTLHTDIGKVIGTLPYMSPEQISGDPDALDTRSDVYSLGVVLYELLSGKPPYEISRGRIHEAARVIKEDEPTRLGLVDRDLRGDLETIVGKALEKERERRYQGVGELAADVRRHLNNEPVQARPSGRAYRLQRLAQRNKLAVAMFIAAFAALIAGLLTSLSQRSNALTARDEAQHARLAEQAQLAIAQTQTEAAVRNQAISDAARAFLVDLLSSANPSKRGRDVRVIEVLDEGAQDLHKRFATDPETEGEMHAMLGETYRGLGETEKAEKECRAALAILEQEHGASSLRAYHAMNDLGVILVSRGSFDEAKTLYETAIPGQRQNGDEKGALTTENNLANLLADRGESLEALRRYQDVADGLEKLLGSDAPKTLSAWSNIGVVLMELQRFSDAEPIFRRVLAAQDRPNGGSPVQLVTALANMASCLKEQGREVDAEPYARRAVETCAAALGPKHPRTIAAQNVLGAILQDEHRLDEAETVQRQALDAASEAYPAGHWVTGLMRSEHGRTLRLMGKLEDAEPELLQGLQELRGALGPENARSRMAEGAVRALYVDWKKPEEASKYRAYTPPK